MIVTIPIGTDAPIYHYPFATGGMIVLNVFVLAVQLMVPEFNDQFALNYGTISPVQWVTSMCMHAGFEHLIGNMIILALVGTIVEGKIGWWRFLLVYFGIGVSANIAEQIIMLLASSGGSLGASGAIFGLIAMCLIWAPENEVTLWVGGLFFFRPFYFQFDASILWLAFFMIAMEFLTLAFSGFGMSSAALHLMGAVPGFILAVAMIKLRRVDCEGFDLLTIMAGKRGKRTRTIADEKAEQERRAAAKIEAQRERETGLKMVERYTQEGHFETAISRFQMLKRNDPALVMTSSQYRRIIEAYNEDPAKLDKTISMLEEYLQHHDEKRVRYTLMLARAYVLSQARPRKGLKLLQGLSGETMSEKEAQFTQRLTAKANAMISSGTLELGD